MDHELHQTLVYLGIAILSWIVVFVVLGRLNRK